MMLWLVLLFCLYALWCFRQWQWLRLTSRIPNVRGTLPIIGVTHQTLGSTERLWRYMESWFSSTTEFGGIAKTQIGPYVFIVVTDCGIALSLMNSYLEKHSVYLFGTSALGNGLVTSNVSIWKRHRKLISPAFTQHVIDEFLPVFNQQSELLVKDLNDKAGKGEFDPLPYISKRSLETICQTAFGVPADAENVVSKEYGNALHKLLPILIKRLTNFWLHPDIIYNRSFTKKEETKAINITQTMSAKVIATGRMTKKLDSLNNKSQNNMNRRFKPFFELMMELDIKGQLSDSEIRDEADTIIAGGYDTTYSTLTILLILLGSYPAVQERAYREIKTIFAESSISITKEELSKLVYVEAVIKEALRLYPIVPVVARTADKNQEFGDIIVPDGIGMLLSIWGVNRNKKYWGMNAEEFNPERWLEPSTLPEDPAAFSSFSLGRRGCIGKSYAILSLKTSLAHLLRTYRIKADHTKMKFKYEILLKPVSGYFISIETR